LALQFLLFEPWTSACTYICWLRGLIMSWTCVLDDMHLVHVLILVVHWHDCFFLSWTFWPLFECEDLLPHIHTHTDIYIYINTHTHICVYICVYVCMYTTELIIELPWIVVLEFSEFVAFCKCCNSTHTHVFTYMCMYIDMAHFPR